jgi:chromosome segregation ATPase
MRGSQQKCGTLERELDSLREELERKRPELDVLPNESAHSRRELAKETETNRALRAQVDACRSASNWR